jgi:molybdopterin synthase sulfur carrier subunit
MQAPCATGTPRHAPAFDWQVPCQHGSHRKAIVAVTVRFFAALRDAAGTSQVEVDPGTLPQIVEDLRKHFGEPFATRVSVATGLLDGHPVRLDQDRAVGHGAELALLPPFSGGSAVTTRERRIEHFLLAGSVLVPGLFVLGAYAGRSAFGVVVIVVCLASLIDLHNALASAGLRTVLPPAIALAVGPAVLVLFAPSLAVAWTPGIVALAVMMTFLLALASDRRHETATIVGSTLLAALFVGLGSAALVLLHDSASRSQLSWALGLIAVADVTANWVAQRSPKPPSRASLLAPAVVAALGALVVWAVAGRAAPAMAAGFGVAAAVAALASARLHQVLRQPDAMRTALLIGTADAVLIGVLLALVWIRVVPA